MERTHFLRETKALATPEERVTTVLELVNPGYPDAAEARKHLNDLEPGIYHLVTFVETDIVVEPPQMPTRNVVKRGTVLQQRKSTVTSIKAGKKGKAPKGDGSGGAPAPAAA